VSIRRVFGFLAKTAALLALIAVVALATLLALIRHEHNTLFTLPEPSGRFAVGRTTYMWTNDKLNDDLSPAPNAKRQVLVWIWYPAATAPSAARAPYVPPAWSSALTQGGLMGLVTRDLSLVRAHSLADPPVAPERESGEHSYPVVIMRAGAGAPTTDFTTLAEDLASHGYVVVGFDAPYRTYLVVLPNGGVITRPPGNDPENLPADQANRLINKLLPMWVTDTKFVVDQLQQLNAAGPTGRFTGRLDLDRLGMFGHSFGGAQALQFCHDDARCKAGIDVDGAPYGSVVHDGLKQPFMFILSDHSHDPPDPANGEIRANFKSIYERLPDGRFFVTIRGANHFSFSDQILLKSRYVIGALQKLGFGNLPPRRGLAITADYVHTFFDVYLKGAPVDQLTNISKQYPEVEPELPSAQ
jgi:dienelactone hydrolase